MYDPMIKQLVFGAFSATLLACASAAPNRMPPLFANADQALALVAELGPEWRQPIMSEILSTQQAKPNRATRYHYRHGGWVTVTADDDGNVSRFRIASRPLTAEERLHVIHGSGCLGLPPGEQLAERLVDATEPDAAGNVQDKRRIVTGYRLGWDRIQHLYSASLGNTDFSFQFFNNRCFLEAGRRGR
jgi:hypothetical protein